ncbi:MAG: toprim domain-containing protein [Succinivibrionaceae bacterium]|nr:toprim domain-containing protein [Succinivibrionaceae bacterium]
MNTPEQEQEKQQLKARIADYLRDELEVNPNSAFRCLNPEHEDRHPSMSLNRGNNTVHCFSCGATYDIFALIGIKEGLASFPDQLRRARELYGAPGTGEQTRFVIATDEPSYGPGEERPETVAQFPLGRRISTPEAEMRPTNSQLVRINPAIQGRPLGDSLPLVEQQPRNDERGTALPEHPQGKVFGAGGLRFESPQGALQRQELDQPGGVPHSYRAYIEQCHAQVGATDYFRRRGISEEVIGRFRLGYDDKFIASSDPLTGQKVWQAAIIPASDNSYTARNLDPSDPDRIRKNHGIRELFNAACIREAAELFVVEGEFDALSLETLGRHAVSLGGVGNVPALIEQLRAAPLPGRTVYICLDNDEAGEQAAERLGAALRELGVPCRRVNLATPYKDPNEILVQNPDRLRERLEGLGTRLAATFGGIDCPAAPAPVPTTLGDLLDPGLAAENYLVAAPAGRVREVMAELMAKSPLACLVVTHDQQWRHACALLPGHLPKGASPQDALALPSRHQSCPSIPEIEPILGHIAEDFMLQNQRRCALLIDLSYTPQGPLGECAGGLAALSSELGIPVILLCNEADAPLLASYALALVRPGEGALPALAP